MVLLGDCVIHRVMFKQEGEVLARTRFFLSLIFTVVIEGKGEEVQSLFYLPLPCSDNML